MILRTILPLGRKVLFGQSRSVSIFNSLETSSVIISSNKDIYTNLALEHLLYNNLRFKDSGLDHDAHGKPILNKPVVVIWTDEPCVVIGRHQNPWIEANVGLLHKAGVKLARRHSGGGCVFHDEKNINISIIGSRRTFENRQENLKFLANFLSASYGIKCAPNARHDLIHDETGSKLTGSAAKLGRYNCYHHFTLLVDTNKEALYTYIRQKQQDFIQSNSSASKRSKVINLKDIKSNIDVDQVISDLAIAYGDHFKSQTTDKASRKDRTEGDKSESEQLAKFKDELQSWDWIYGKTPRFKLERILPLIEQGISKTVKFSVTVNKGSFEEISIDSDVNDDSLRVDTYKSILGNKFEYKDAMVAIAKLLQVDKSGKEDICVGKDKVLGMLLLQMVHESHF